MGMSATDSKLAILRRVKEIREAAGWPDGDDEKRGNQTKFAKEMGVKPNYYKTYETRSLMSPEKLERFCQITGAKPEYILFGWLPKWKSEDLNRIYDEIVPANLDIFKKTIAAYRADKSHPES